jgi:histidinol-phosphate/aromatic aminotransferase/cobyric acid decarboxylase-like protein
MAKKKVMIAGNRWPEWPQHVRVTVGTYEEMQKFNAALTQVVKEGPVKA